MYILPPFIYQLTGYLLIIIICPFIYQLTGYLLIIIICPFIYQPTGNLLIIIICPFIYQPTGYLLIIIICPFIYQPTGYLLIIIICPFICMEIQNFLCASIAYLGNDFYFWHMKGKSPGIFYIQTEDGKGNHAPTLETFCKQEGIRFVRVLLEGLEEDGISIREGIITDWLSGCQSVLKEVGLGSQVLVGHGIGGWLMFLLALREPDLVSGLVGLATLPDFPDLLWKGFSKEEKVEIKRKNYHTFERRGIKFRIPISVFPEASK